MRCNQQHIGIDVVTLGHSPQRILDVATLGQLAKLTGGQVYAYPNFTAATHGAALMAEVSRALTREQGFEAVMRVRCSRGTNDAR
jgi:hypothetical protein